MQESLSITATCSRRNTTTTQSGSTTTVTGHKPYTIQNVESLTLDKSLESFPNRFSLSFFTDQAVDLRGCAITIKINGTAFFHGYVNRMRISRSFESGLHIMIDGLTQLHYIMSCSCTNNARWVTGTLYAIANQLCSPYGVTVLDRSANSSVTTSQLPFQIPIDLGQSPFTVIERQARYEKKILYDQDGSLVICDLNDKKPVGAIDNSVIKNYDYELSNLDLYNEIEIFQTDSNSLDATKYPGATGVATFNNPVVGPIKKYKYELNSFSYTDGRPDYAQQGSTDLANWMMNRSVGRSRRLDFEVPTLFYDSAQKNIWDVNKLLTVNLPDVMINNENLLIANVSMNFSRDTGSSTRITMMPPQAFSLEPVNTIDGNDPNTLGQLTNQGYQ